MMFKDITDDEFTTKLNGMLASAEKANTPKDGSDGHRMLYNVSMAFALAINDAIGAGALEPYLLIIQKADGFRLFDVREVFGENGDTRNQTITDFLREEEAVGYLLTTPASVMVSTDRSVAESISTTQTSLKDYQPRDAIIFRGEHIDGSVAMITCLISEGNRMNEVDLGPIKVVAIQPAKRHFDTETKLDPIFFNRYEDDGKHGAVFEVGRGELEYLLPSRLN